MPTFKQLEALAWIAKLGTFEKAAGQLGTTQSAVSKRVQEIEDLAATPLFDRGGRSAGLTARGAAVVALAEELLRLRGELLAVLGAPFVVPRLRIGITELTAMTWLPALVSALAEAVPDCRPEPVLGSTRSLRRQLEDREIDVAVVSRDWDGRGAASRGLPLGEVRLDWVASPRLGLGGRRLTAAELGQHPLLGRDERDVVGQWIAAWRREAGITAGRVVMGSGLMPLVGMAVAGLGITCIPRGLFPELREGGQLEVLETEHPPPSIPYVLLHRGDESLPRAFLALLESLVLRCCDFTRPLTQGPWTLQAAG